MQKLCFRKPLAVPQPRKKTAIQADTQSQQPVNPNANGEIYENAAIYLEPLMAQRLGQVGRERQIINGIAKQYGD